jgi:dolichyl-phosphate-mannose--protein O-mannosyl transferase
MNSNRALLFMQIVTVVPLVIFLLMYAQGIGYTVLAIFLLLVLAVNSYLSIQNKAIKNYPIVFMLMGSFYLYAFYGLGSTQTPQTFHTSKMDRA